jgi:HEPN domain-containing protein
MISVEEIRAVADARLQDALVLLGNERLDGAAYLCGYAVELALKARICVTLSWPGFPETRSEFENYTSFRTHKLDVLLRLSGQEQRIKTEYLSEWSVVARWDPEARYKPIGHAEREGVELMLACAINLMNAL